MFLNVKARGLEVEPSLAVGDGASGFRKAIRQVRPSTRGQRCWVPKSANVLDKQPKGAQPKAKSVLHAIYEAETKAAAGSASDPFATTYHAKYPKATDYLAKDREALLSFYDSPAGHWRHIRTINPIESGGVFDDGLQADGECIKDLAFVERISPPTGRDPGGEVRRWDRV